MSDENMQRITEGRIPQESPGALRSQIRRPAPKPLKPEIERIPAEPPKKPTKGRG